MSVTASTLTPVESSPVGAEALWTLPSLFIADWSAGMEVTTSWPTSIEAAGTSAEKRSIDIGRPLRRLRFTIKATIEQESWRLKNLLRRMGICRSLVPLYPDYTILTAASSGAVLACDTTLRRLFVGARVAIAAPFTGGTTYKQFEVGVIQSMTSTAITLAAAPSIVYPAGSWVAPLLQCDVWGQASANNRGGGRLGAEIIAAEVPGPTALPALLSRTDAISLGTYAGYPVFDPGLNRNVGWRDTADAWQRDLLASQLGHGTINHLMGPRPRAHPSRQAKPVTRADAWNMLQFWDYSCGPTYPFLAVNAYPLFEPRALTTTTVQVTAAGPLEDWNDYPYLAVVKRQTDNGAARVRPIGSVTRASGVDTITLSDPLDAFALNTVAYVAPAHLVRFEQPDLIEKWTTSRALTLDFRLLELLNEHSVTIANL